jgi:hypothetical protein
MLIRRLTILAMSCSLLLTAGCKKDESPAPATPTAEAEALSPSTAAGATAEAPAKAAQVHGGTTAGNTVLPPGHPPVPGLNAPANAASAEKDANPPAAAADTNATLAPRGPGSQAELDGILRRLANVQLPEGTVERITRAFHLAFHADRSKREYLGAKKLMMPLRKDPSTGAVANRILAYCSVNYRFDETSALYHYLKAVEFDERYGEAHFGLALMYTRSDQNKAIYHYQRAIALGVEDVHGLGQRFQMTPKTP